MIILYFRSLVHYDFFKTKDERYSHIFFCRFMANRTLVLSIENIFQHSVGQFVSKVKIHSTHVKPLNPHMDASCL